LKYKDLFIIHFLWICVSFAPLHATAQERDTIKIKFELPADTVLPGQKKPFTESQRLEANNTRYLKRAVIPSLILIGAGVAVIPDNNVFSRFDINNARDKFLPNFATEADDFLMLAPLAGLYGFNIISSQNRHELGRQTLLLTISGTLTSALVWPTKKFTAIERPNGKPHAFPSGHTAYAFTIATFMDKEFRHKSPWISVVSYGIAGTTGVLRVLNDAHWMSDILAGAGVGILSVNTVYWIHAKLTSGGGLNTAVIPVVLPNGKPGVGMYVHF
jgi:membrane-associated phospholipid phosphatase